MGASLGWRGEVIGESSKHHLTSISRGPVALSYSLTRPPWPHLHPSPIHNPVPGHPRRHDTHGRRTLPARRRYPPRMGHPAGGVGRGLVPPDHCRPERCPVCRAVPCVDRRPRQRRPDHCCADDVAVAGPDRQHGCGCGALRSPFEHRVPHSERSRARSTCELLDLRHVGDLPRRGSLVHGR